MGLVINVLKEIKKVEKNEKKMYLVMDNTVINMVKIINIYQANNDVLYICHKHTDMVQQKLMFW